MKRRLETYIFSLLQSANALQLRVMILLPYPLADKVILFALATTFRWQSMVIMPHQHSGSVLSSCWNGTKTFRDKETEVLVTDNFCGKQAHYHLEFIHLNESKSRLAQYG
jgi:hypothetical protein